MASLNLLESLLQKGWTVRDAAQYLGVSRQRLHTVLGESLPARLWECAVAGLPACTADLKKRLAQSRKSTEKPKKTAVKKKAAAPLLSAEFEVNDEVVAAKYVGIADEGDRGVIKALRKSSTHPQEVELLISMDSNQQEDWFPTSFFHEHFGTTGLKRSTA